MEGRLLAGYSRTERPRVAVHGPTVATARLPLYERRSYEARRIRGPEFGVSPNERRAPGQMRTLSEQAAAVASSEVSPVDLVEAALKEIDRAQPILNAFTHILADDALARAKQLEGAEPVGPLHGVPIVIKELYDVTGLPTTGCCAAYAERIASSDSAVVEKLRAAGAVVVAKSNQHELACGATTLVSSFGPCFNPWDQARTPGGSSGGSGAAVASGIVAMAMGSDTGGSVRIPSSFCGVTGLKPTHGAVSLRGAMPMTPSFDTGGPLARSASDCALTFSIISGADPEYLWSEAGTPLSSVEAMDGVTIGLVSSYLRNAHPETRKGIEDAAKVFDRLGATVEAIDGLDPWDSRARFGIALLAEVAHCFRDLWDDPRVSPSIVSYFSAGRGFTGVDCAASYEEARRMRIEFLRALADVDALLVPCTPFPAPRIDDTEIPLPQGSLDVHAGGPATLTMPANAAGLPSLAFPVGFSPGGLPLGAQLIGPPWSEARLCSIGAAYQEATDWHLRRPELS